MSASHRPLERSSNRTTTVVLVLAAFVLAVGGCGDTSDDDEAATTTIEESSTTEDSSTSSTSGSTTTDDSTTTTTPDEQGLGDTERCTNPEGFSISYPADWVTNDGSVTEPCSQFNPDPFTVPEASDARVAAVTAFVDAVPFSDVATPDPDSNQLRAVTAVGGHQAVRVSGPSPGDGLYPTGTPETRYVIDLSLGVDDGPGTLFLDVVGVGDVDYEQASRILDLMVRTIELDGSDIESTDPATVARYEGGGTPLAVLAESDTEGDGVCLRLDVAGATSCVGEVGADSPIRTARLGDDLQPLLAGTAASDVFRIEARQGQGPASSFLPVAVADTSATRGWAFPFGREDVTELVWYDIDGNELGSRSIDQGDADEGPDPIGEFDDEQITSDGFPGTGQPSFLTDVRIGANDGFDRVVFQLTDDGSELGYEIEFADDALQQPSGQPLELAGDQVITVTMSPATRVDLSGDTAELTYDGPDRFSPDAATAVQAVALAEDFESVMVWAIGVDDGARVAVAVLEDPRRLVVDIAPPAG